MLLLWTQILILYVGLDEITFGYIKANANANDPDGLGTAFYVIFNGDANPLFPFDPLSIDWEREGSAISESRHLKYLEIRDLRQDTDEHWFHCQINQVERIRNAKAFYRSVAANRSLQVLSIKGNIMYGLEMKDTVALIRPFTQNNNNLCSVELGGFTLDVRTTQILASALSHCVGSLSSFALKRCDGLTERAMKKIINALRVKPTITNLSLDEIDIDDEVASVLGNALATLESLKSLSLQGDYDMRNGSISSAGMEAISDGLSQNCTLERLSFRRNPIGVDGGLYLAEAIANNSALTLKVLDLTSALYSDEFALSPQGWSVFFDLLHNSPLQILRLCGNNMSDVVIPSMAECLNSMASLSEINLWHCSDITASGWTNFFRLLKSNMSLRKCDMYDGNTVDGTGVLAAISSTLCDRTSVECTFNSNHILECVGGFFSFLSESDPAIEILT